MYNDGFAGVCVFKRNFIRISATSLLIFCSLAFTIHARAMLYYHYCPDGFFNPKHNISHSITIETFRSSSEYSSEYSSFGSYYKHRTQLNIGHPDYKIDTPHILKDTTSWAVGGFWFNSDTRYSRSPKQPLEISSPKTSVMYYEIYSSKLDRKTNKLMCFCGNYGETPVYIMKDYNVNVNEEKQRQDCCDLCVKKNNLPTKKQDETLNIRMGTLFQGSIK